MMELTFAEQVKILLKRRKMTIKDLADLIEVQTGKKMSRQNLTQQLGRDNFQEKDMRMIAGVLGCAMQLSLIHISRRNPHPVRGLCGSAPGLPEIWDV